MGRLGVSLARFRNRILWSGAALGALAFAIVTVPAYRHFAYQATIREQGELLGRISRLEENLDSLADSGDGKSAEKVGIVHRLLSDERALFRVRGSLEPSDRVSTYKDSLGEEVHRVLDELGKKGFMVPEGFIESVRGQIGYFTEPGNRATLIRCFARKPRYEAIIRRELERLKLPADFLYIAMQESMFDTAALSSNGARGLWQLVPETAREHDLSVPEDWKDLPPGEDDRTRPRASSRAAAEYLRLLYNEFGDPALAMAAYNAGAGKMRKNLRRIEDPVNDPDFWYLYRMGMMSAETRQFVPKIIAMILIDRNRDRYGFKPQ